jgi:lipopolysaccharide heptosyltransferase I
VFNNILLIKPSAIGDVVHTLPTLSALRKLFPKAKISWLLTPLCAELIKDHPALDEIIIFERNRLGKAWKSHKALSELVRFLRTLHSRGFDLVIDLQGLFRTGFFAFVTGASTRIGLSEHQEGAGLFYSHVVPVRNHATHAVDRYLLCAKALGWAGQEPYFFFPLDEEVRRKSGKLLKEHGLEPGAPYAVIAPGASNPRKLWRTEGFSAVARHLRERHEWTPVIVGSPAEQELADKVAEKIAKPVVNVAGRTTVKELAAVVRGAKFLIGNDSAPMQIASACGVPCVALFGPTNPVRAGPYMQLDAVLCPTIEDPAFVHRWELTDWMNEITDEMVIQRVEYVIEKNFPD